MPGDDSSGGGAVVDDAGEDGNGGAVVVDDAGKDGNGGAVVVDFKALFNTYKIGYLSK